MYVCICNAITENDVKENPELKKLVGTVCGQCIDKDERTIELNDKHNK